MSLLVDNSHPQNKANAMKIKALVMSKMNLGTTLSPNITSSRAQKMKITEIAV